jgi:hypothetical protein
MISDGVVPIASNDSLFAAKEPMAAIFLTGHLHIRSEQNEHQLL